ncbi:VOC family protein [Microbacterium sp. HMH0099]|uniref:VOC family protein n=1 Tax=Microbacterium sp. HMH0099 TaxID=3414026 RepID=UPI003BF68CB1
MLDVMASVEHFEIPADDVARAQAFYGKVFGFTFEDWGDGNIMLRTGSGAGIDGDIHKRGPVSHPTVVISVPDLEGTIAAVIDGGGEQLGAIESMGETARYAYVKDSEGNVIGLYADTP